MRRTAQARRSAALAREGARVIVTDIEDTLGQASASQVGASWRRLAVRDDLAWSGALARVPGSHGRVHVLVDDAGIAGLEPTAGGTPHPHDAGHGALEDGRAAHCGNLDGVLMGCRHAFRAMRRQRAGSIINTSSRSGNGFWISCR